MKIQNMTVVDVLSKVEKPGVKDPNKTYYYVVVAQDEDAGRLSCPKEVYDAVKPDDRVTLITEYNEQYSSFRVIDIVKPNNGASAPADAKAVNK